MKIRLAENIKRFRKEHRLTQEQLADTLGVTVGAVHKWEHGLSTPDITLIIALADFFETSTDVLLGYEWQGGNTEASLSRIRALSADKRHEEAGLEAEKLLKKFPNSFDIVYQSGLVYLARGEDTRERGAEQRAVALLEHACELIAQNTDDSVTEVSIRTQIAKAHLRLGNVRVALNLLKKYNACGVNNAFIGMILADFIHDVGEAGKYLGMSVASSIANLDYAMIGYINTLFQQGNCDVALDCVQWLRNMLRGIQAEDELTYFDKYDCVLLETMAEIYCFKNEPEFARRYLRAALEKARRYDTAAPDEIHGVRIYEDMGIDYQPTYDSFGKTALGCLKARMQLPDKMEADDDEPPYLRQLWSEELNEVFPDEEV